MSSIDHDKMRTELRTVSQSMHEAIFKIQEVMAKMEVPGNTDRSYWTFTPKGAAPRRAYISGAISADTGEGRDRKLQKFAEAQAFLEARGWAVVNPLEVGACANGVCVERDGAPEPGSSQSDEIVHSWNCYMRNDIRALMECDVIFMIPGWEASRGATVERQVAVDVGIDCRYLASDHLHSGAFTLANPKVNHTTPPKES